MATTKYRKNPKVIKNNQIKAGRPKPRGWGANGLFVRCNYTLVGLWGSEQKHRRTLTVTTRWNSP